LPATVVATPPKRLEVDLGKFLLKALEKTPVNRPTTARQSPDQRGHHDFRRAVWRSLRGPIVFRPQTTAKGAGRFAPAPSFE